MYYDLPYLLIMLVGMALSYGAQAWVTSTYNKFAQVASRAGRSGADIARRILDTNGLNYVELEATEGVLSDHYDPTHKTVRLSRQNYADSSISAVAVAAHECGHAIQHAQGYYPVILRSNLAPIANIGSQFGPLMILGGLMLMAFGWIAPSLGYQIAWIGVIGFGLAVLFHLVTLPVELDASHRALAVLADGGYLAADEMPGAKNVLTAAAFTYVAGALHALMQLAYWIFQLLGRRD